MTTKKAIRIISISLITLLIVAGLIFRGDLISGGSKSVKKEASPKTEEKTDKNTIPAKSIRIKTSKLVDRIRVTGTVLPNEEVELTSEVGGIITQINFSEGQSVNRGALLVKINDADLRAQMERLASQLELYRNREYRQKKLLEKGGVSQDEYEEALAQLNEIKAQIKETKAKILRTEIRAPFSGVIGLRDLSLGSYVNPGIPIVRLVNLDKLKIEFSAPEKYMSRLLKGQTVYISSEINEEIYEGKIYALEPKIDLTTRTIAARAILENQRQTLMPGAFVNIEIILKEYQDAIQVPTITVISELGGQKVFLYKNGQAVPVMVKTGIRTKESVQILEGISVGDTLISSNLLGVRPNVGIELLEVK